MHEYVIMWSRPKAVRSMLLDLSSMARDTANRLTSIWRAIVKNALIALGGSADLQSLYSIIQGEAPDKLQANKNWQAKIRQVLQTYKDFSPVERGVWKLA